MARYIDADALIAELNERIEAAIKWGANAIADRNDEIRIRAEQAVATFCEASLTAKKMPAADVAPVRHGKWTIGERTNVYGGREIFCSECGESFMVSPKTLEFLSDTERYCCRCGAKMDGGAIGDPMEDDLK